MDDPRRPKPKPFERMTVTELKQRLSGTQKLLQDREIVSSLHDDGEKLRKNVIIMENLLKERGDVEAVSPAAALRETTIKFRTALPRNSSDGSGDAPYRAKMSELEKALSMMDVDGERLGLGLAELTAPCSRDDFRLTVSDQPASDIRPAVEQVESEPEVGEKHSVGSVLSSALNLPDVPASSKPLVASGESNAKRSSLPFAGLLQHTRPSLSGKHPSNKPRVNILSMDEVFELAQRDRLQRQEQLLAAKKRLEETAIPQPATTSTALVGHNLRAAQFLSYRDEEEDALSEESEDDEEASSHDEAELEFPNEDEQHDENAS